MKDRVVGVKRGGLNIWSAGPGGAFASRNESSDGIASKKALSVRFGSDKNMRRGVASASHRVMHR